ncbi:hypothetical protein SAMN04487970_100675 [Paenibacillus tianmuensis]|uniref:Uncharacterized protein n=1 Tax=Paenibacillus tianmuensis TaxID=624147 RepID=A0A1G4QB61_9BACL|nr:hypothetical protein SAMN04487970_100675 [Paenibacillus tianmuensis]
MKNCITIPSVLQSILSAEEVKSIVQMIGYEDKARKFTVYDLLQYWCTAAHQQWEGYRAGADCAHSYGLIQVHYSSFSSKQQRYLSLFSKSFFICLSKNVVVRRVENWLSLKNCFLLIPQQ